MNYSRIKWSIQLQDCEDGPCDGYLVVDDTLAIPGPASLGEVVDGGELDEGGEHKCVAHGDEPVHGRGVGHLGQ